MKPYIAIIAMVNGMIGGLILVLPILAQNGGVILSGIIIAVTGFFSLYSCYLCVIHLGDHSDLDKALVAHFNGSKGIKIFYDFLVFINLVFLLLLYFSLIVEQWEGLLPYNLANPLCNAAALIILTFVLNYFHFGAQLLGYGIISIIGYLIFLIWLIATAPKGNHHIPLFGSGAVNLAASMGQAFAIQTFFIPVLRELPNSKNFVRYTAIAYAIGASAYLYIAYLGSFGIVNRSIVVPKLQTIEMFFHPDTWEVALVEVIYLIHLYSAFGEFLLVAKKRFCGIFNLIESGQGKLLNIPEIILVVCVVGACLGVELGQVSIGILIEVNGAIIGFFFIYLLPALMHAKCLYLPCWKSTEQEALEEETMRRNMIELKDMAVNNIEDLERNLSKLPENSVKMNRSVSMGMDEKDKKEEGEGEEKGEGKGEGEQKKEGEGSQTQAEGEIEQKIAGPCKCKKPSFALQIVDIVSLVGMVGLGTFIMVDGFISVITGQS